MSSNPAELPSGAAATPAPRASWSLTTRLALLTSAASFIILAAVSIQMYFQLSGHLKDQNIRFLTDEVEKLGELARFPEFGEMMADEMHIDPVGEEYVTHYVRLMNGEGRIVIETPGMRVRLPRELFPPPGNTGKAAGAVPVRGQNDSSYVITSLRVKTALVKDATLQVGLDVTNVERVLAGYRKKLALTLGMSFFLCTAVGLAVARRGTRPIREITAKARQITVTSLDERLSGNDWPRELTELAGALNEMLDRLQDSFGRLYGSVANLTHKLRTPITVLKGEAEIALKRERSPEELREVIASGLEEYERLSHLVDNIIFIAQAEAGKLHHVPVRLKARTEIDKVLEFYAPQAEEKGIAVTVEGDAELSADPALFRKAVANLLSNALIFTPEGGTVTVTARQADDGSAEIRVTDTGCGIAEEEMPKIFDRFYRVYATRFMDPHGSGLGLSLVRTIMDLHNGVVELRNAPGHGTTAILSFPPAQ